jgi:predicted PurR-regulated permease PerM
MSRIGYQALGFAVWRGIRWYARRRFGGLPRRLALAGVVVAAIAILVAAGRRA